MRDVDKRDAHALLDVLELVLHVLAEPQVERAERLVEQQHLRPVHERARNSNTLLLAAGKRRDAPVLEALEAHDLEHLRHAFVDLFFRELCKS